MEAADTATGVTTATGGTDIRAVGAVMAAGVAADIQGTVWVAATTTAVVEAMGVRIERPERCTLSDQDGRTVARRVPANGSRLQSMTGR